MTNGYSSRPEINGLLWWVGWRPLATIVIFTVSSILLVLVTRSNEISVLGFFIGLVVWFVGVNHINEKYPEELRYFMEFSREKSKERLGMDGSDADFYHLTGGRGSKPLINTYKEYHTSVFLVGEESASVYEGFRLDMVERKAYEKRSSTELYYDQISSIDFKDPFIQITMSNGREHLYTTDSPPDELLNNLHRRVKSYKQ